MLIVFFLLLGFAYGSQSMLITATIEPKCTLVVNNLDFGSYDLETQTGTDSSTTFSVKCTTNTPYTITANRGDNGTISKRQMSNGKDFLTYNLFIDNTRTKFFGDGTESSAPIEGTGVGVNKENVHTIYGRIPSGQDPGPGDYKDIVTITIVY